MTNYRTKVTCRCPELVPAFGLRLRAILRHLDMQQQELAAAVGGCRPETLSFLINGKSTQVAVDLMIRISVFVHGRGISLPWLLAGEGEMVNPLVASKSLSEALLLAIARKVGVDI